MDLAPEETIFGFFGEIYEIYEIYDRVGDGDKFSYGNFGLGRSRFYFISYLNTEANEFFS